MKKLGELIEAKNPTLAKAFEKGATKQKLAALSKAIGSLPVDLSAWFAWHDGMTKPQSLGPEENWSLMSIRESIDAWKFLGKPSRFPLLDNGAGDYVLYETAKKGQGALHCHWHDRRESTKFAPTLAAYIARLTKEYGALEVSKWRPVIVSKPTKWSKVTRVPSEAQLAKRPIGAPLSLRRGEAHASWQEEVYPDLRQGR